MVETDTVVALVIGIEPATAVLLAFDVDTVVVLEAETVAVVPVVSSVVADVVALLRRHLYACDSTLGRLGSNGSLNIQGMRYRTNTLSTTAPCSHWPHGPTHHSYNTRIQYHHPPR